MKKLIFLAVFCLVASKMTAQGLFSPQMLKNHPNISKVLENVSDMRKGAYTNNVELRLDSTTEYSGYFLGDSTLYSYSLYSYPSPSISITDNYSRPTPFLPFNQTSSIIFIVDFLNRLVSYESYQYSSGSPVLSYSIKLFWRGSSNLELDSLYVMDGVGSRLSKDYIYDADSKILQNREYNYDLSGNPNGVIEYRYSYQGDGRIEATETDYGPSLSTLEPLYRNLYAYSGDTIKSVYQIYDLLNWKDQSTTYEINLPGEDLVWKRLTYYIDGMTQETYLGFSTESEYDAEKRRTSYLILSQASSTAVPYSNKIIYAYIQDHNFDFTSNYDIDVATGAATLQSRRFYHYEEVSSTKSLFLPSDAVHISPNPGHDLLRIDARERDIISVELMDLSGRVLLTQAPGQPVAFVDVARIPRSPMLLRVLTSEGSLTKLVLLE
jgi:hypothetical protein